jgi:glycosyltransferase involved in cell wall biosynthesis
LDSLKSLAHKNIEFLGFLPDDEIAHYYQNCVAVIFPTFEDFGIVPVEAQAYGKPVVAYRGGGALETVIEGETGIFFNEQTAESLRDLLEMCSSKYGDCAISMSNMVQYIIRFSAEKCRENAQNFNKKRFQEQFYRLHSK